MPNERDKIDIFLLPGEFRVGTAEYRVRTLLGSCVSITLWSKKHQVGAMSHFLLATRGRRAHTSLDGRYGEDALKMMLAGLAAMGIAPQECEAKIFGGASMFPTLARTHIGVGRANGDLARRLLEDQGISVKSECLYGSGHRSIIFDIGTGDVWGRQVRPDEVACATPLQMRHARPGLPAYA
ncbi:MAG: chemotaxis protein CheD [Pseudomonadota bacterium]